VAHRRSDDVAVAITDLAAGELIEVRVLEEGAPSLSVQVREGIALGHKIALREIPAGHEVTEYGEQIGRATQPISAGSHVHVHNIRSARWPA
jgi:(2R)-sulfolactate sulfo-lyase subunit alpha